MTAFEHLPQPDTGKASSESPTPAWPVIDKPSRGYRKPIIAVGLALTGVAFAYATSTIGAAGGGTPADGGPPVAAPGPTSGRPGDDTTPTATGAPTPGEVHPTISLPPAGGPWPGASAEPADPAEDAEAGDCLSLTGPPGDPDARIVRCAPGRFRVVRRFDAEQDRRACTGVPRVDRTYVSREDDFVLCLRRV